MQLTLLNWDTKSELEKISAKIRKYFPIHFTCSESCALSKVIYQTMKMNWKYQLQCIKNTC